MKQPARVRRPAGVGERRLVGVVELAGRRGEQPRLADGHRRRGRADHPQHGVAVVGDERVEEHEVADPVGDVGQAAGHDGTPVREPEEHDVVEVLVEDLVDDVGDVRAQRDLGTREVGPFADAGEAGREHVVVLGPQQRSDVTEPVGPAPCAVHQHVGRHVPAPFGRRRRPSWRRPAGPVDVQVLEAMSEPAPTGSASSMPAAFVGHGSPMNALDDNRYTQAWQAFGAAVPRPRAVLVVSAHWFINATAVTAMAVAEDDPRLLRVPRGAVRRALPGTRGPGRWPPRSPSSWRRRGSALDRDSWGLDHGTWSVLVPRLPGGRRPRRAAVDQRRAAAASTTSISVPRSRPCAIAGVLIVGSGNVVHNLRRVDWARPDEGFDWAHRFDDAAREVMTTDPADAARLQRAPRLRTRRADPRPLHPAAVRRRAGGCGGGDRPRCSSTATRMGSLSMTAYAVS